jgi:hypothetical protein
VTASSSVLTLPRSLVLRSASAGAWEESRNFAAARCRWPPARPRTAPRNAPHGGRSRSRSRPSRGPWRSTPARPRAQPSQHLPEIRVHSAGSTPG